MIVTPDAPDLPTAAGGPSLGGLYSPPRSPVIVDVPEMTYLAIDGDTAPAADPAWTEAVGRLREAEQQLTGPLDRPRSLEVLWRADGTWMLLLAIPARAVRQARADDLPASVRVHRRRERWAAQVLADRIPAERATALDRLERFLTRQGYHAVGPLHEILLDDPRPALPGGETRGRRCILRRTVVAA